MTWYLWLLVILLVIYFVIALVSYYLVRVEGAYVGESLIFALSWPWFLVQMIIAGYEEIKEYFESYKLPRKK